MGHSKTLYSTLLEKKFFIRTFHCRAYHSKKCTAQSYIPEHQRSFCIRTFHAELGNSPPTTFHSKTFYCRKFYFRSLMKKISFQQIPTSFFSSSSVPLPHLLTQHLFTNQLSVLPPLFSLIHLLAPPFSPFSSSSSSLPSSLSFSRLSSPSLIFQHYTFWHIQLYSFFTLQVNGEISRSSSHFPSLWNATTSADFQLHTLSFKL